jgi:radical SAM superfamily enzyme YgiQ (UPF0313 family)
MVKHLYGHEWSRIRFRKVDHVMAELRAVKAAFPNIERINFYDETFRPSVGWAEDFFGRYRKEIGLPSYCEVYPGSCPEEMVKIMKGGLLAGVWIGIQSGSARVRNEVFRRHYTNDLVIKQALIFNKYGVSVRYDFILDNPFESFEESLESIHLMMELPEPFSLSLFSLKFFPNTDITAMALKSGAVTADELDDMRLQDRHNIHISRSEADTERNFINHLAMYISFLAVRGEVRKSRPRLAAFIDDFRKTGKIGEVKEALEVFL